MKDYLDNKNGRFVYVSPLTNTGDKFKKPTNRHICNNENIAFGITKEVNIEDCIIWFREDSVFEYTLCLLAYPIYRYDKSNADKKVINNYKLLIGITMKNPKDESYNLELAESISYGRCFTNRINNINTDTLPKEINKLTLATIGTVWNKKLRNKRFRSKIRNIITKDKKDEI